MLDLPAYFRRIGLAKPARVSFDAVRDIAYHHALAIPFENLDAYLGRGVDLSLAGVERKLVSQRRGGWCFEHNLLLGEALRELGVEVTDLAARVLWFRPEGHRAARTHRLLSMTLDGRRVIADVGFGGLTLAGILPLEEGEHATAHEMQRLRREADEWVLEVRIAGMWQPQYRFDLQPWWPEDFEAPNFHLAHDPASAFRRTLMAARALPDGRLSLEDAEFTRRSLDGRVHCRQLQDVSELLEVLECEFELPVRRLPGIDTQLAACFVPRP